MKNKQAKLDLPLTWLIRIIIGCVFVFSGFSKAIDPWGTLYKVNDYLGVLSLSIWPNLVLVGVFGLCAIEFLTGIFLLLGCFRRSTAIVAALIMAGMLPLSLWIAISDPVADCGCFGDAFIISNWTTFCKNIVISIGIIWLIRYNRKPICLVTSALQWIAFVVSAFFILTIELFGYISQPLIDFRPYKTGESLIDMDNQYSDEPEYLFIYEKDGIRKEFNMNDSLPDGNDGWIFIDRKEIKKSDSSENGSKINDSRNLRIWSKDGEEDETELAITEDGKELLIMMPDLKEVSPATTWKLNSLYEWSLKNDIVMIAVVSGSPKEISTWEDLSMASYPIYTADDTQIKEVVRGNPGVVYLENGKIQWKSTLTAINIDDFLLPEATYDARNFSFDNLKILLNCTYIYLIIVGVLIVLSFTPKIQYLFSHSKHDRGLRRNNTDSKDSYVSDSPEIDEEDKLTKE